MKPVYIIIWCALGEKFCVVNRHGVGLYSVKYIENCQNGRKTQGNGCLHNIKFLLLIILTINFYRNLRKTSTCNGLETMQENANALQTIVMVINLLESEIHYLSSI